MSTLPKPIAGTIKEQAYQILKEEICSGYYTPGQWLQEKELAAHLNVSRSPIREALRKLASDGLVVEIPNKGVFVKEFTAQDITDIFDLRVLLENNAIKRSQEHLTQERRETLLHFINDLTLLHNQSRLEEYITTDAALHDFIIELGGNSLLVDSYHKVKNITQQFRVYSLLGQQRFDESVEEHRIIVYGILNDSLEEATQINQIHLERAKQKILEHMAEQETIDASQS